MDKKKLKKKVFIYLYGKNSSNVPLLTSHFRFIFDYLCCLKNLLFQNK